MKILVVDDEASIRRILETRLKMAGYNVVTAEDGEEAVELFNKTNPDIVILDVMMPKMDGYEVARQVRSKRCSTPILMLTAKSEVEDRIKGLNSGADYYLTKPFYTDELLACINALLRRQGSQVDELVYGNTSLDLSSGKLICGGKSVRLSAKEFDVMRLLMNTGERNLSKESLLARVGGYDSNAVENHVEVYIGFLRKKLRSIGSDVCIEVGSMFVHDYKCRRSRGLLCRKLDRLLSPLL